MELKVELVVFKKKKSHLIIVNKDEEIVWTILRKMEIREKSFMITKIEQANLRKRVQIECAVWHLDVGLAHPHECKNHEGFDCSSIKELHELGLIRRETVWFLSSRGNYSIIKIAPSYERSWECWPMVYLLFIIVFDKFAST